MRCFVLQRNEDETGVSGTGFVAEGVEFDNGKVAITWTTDVRVDSVTVYDTIAEIEQIHGHGGKTKIVWIWPITLQWNSKTKTMESVPVPPNYIPKETI